MSLICNVMTSIAPLSSSRDVIQCKIIVKSIIIKISRVGFREVRESNGPDEFLNRRVKSQILSFLITSLAMISVYIRLC